VNDWNSYAEVKIKTNTSFAASKTASLSALTVYPNPAGATFTVKFNLSSNGNTTLAIYDMSGKQLLVPVNGRLTAGTYTKTVSAAALPAGMYLVKLVHNGQVSSMKIIRE